MVNLSLLLSTLLVLPFLAHGATYGFYSNNSHWYLAVTSTTPINDYTSALALANAQWLNGKQGYLVTVNDAGESNYVFSYIASQLTPAQTAGTAWIGAKKSGTSWAWYALNRVSTTFYDQNQGCLTYNNQYCNWLATPAATATCAQMYLPSVSGTPPQAKWVGVDCTSAPTNTIIVEFDTPTGTSCTAGFTNVNGVCKDIDECAAGTTVCNAGYQCVNTLGSSMCSDINECTATPNICGSGYTCANTDGSYTCTDINECTATPNICGNGYSCTNTAGSYTCADINECLAGPCTTGQTCTNTQGSYTCTTPATQGYYTCTITNTPTTFYIQSNLNGLVVDLSSLNAGDVLVMANATSSPTQQWSLTADGVFINKQTGFAIDIKGADTAIDTPIVSWYPKAAGDNLNQKWSYDPTTLLITSQFTANRLLDVRDVNAAAGTPLCLYSPKTADYLNQQWYLASTLMPITPPTA